jgi:hypothetical protein
MFDRRTTLGVSTANVPFCHAVEVPDGDTDGLGDADGLADGLGEAEALGDGLGEGLAEALGEGLAVTVPVQGVPLRTKSVGTGLAEPLNVPLKPKLVLPPVGRDAL